MPRGATPDRAFWGSWPYAPRSFGHGGACTTRTKGRGPVVMPHDNPTWGYVYRNFAAPSSTNGRCAMPDHVGFGRPDKPLDLVVN